MTTQVDKDAAAFLLVGLQTIGQAELILEANVDETPLGQVARQQLEQHREIRKRLVEVADALASGTFRTVDEGAVVRVLTAVFEAPAPKTTSATRRAQLALEQLNFGLALR